MAILVPHFRTRCADLVVFSHRRYAIWFNPSYKRDFFSGEESNNRRTISWRFPEHVESVSETHPYLLFFPDLNNFSCEFESGPTFIQSEIKC